MNSTAAERAFRQEYGAHRRDEGRGMSAEALLALPYVRSGPLARQWAVRARTYDAFVAQVLSPMARELERPLDLLDLGAGNGWLCSRAVRAGHHAVALDVREDDVDGLGAAAGFLGQPGGQFTRVAASFESLPMANDSFDIVVFNASLHYALDLRVTLGEARRVTRRGGRVVVLDTPFYGTESDGLAMVSEKHRTAGSHFGARADALMSLPFIEFLTRERLRDGSAGLGLDWRRHRVRYPLWYELRPLTARLRGARVPSRFDLWDAVVP